MKKVLLISVSALALSAGAALAGGVSPAPGDMIWEDSVGAVGQQSGPSANATAGNYSTIEQIGSGNYVGNSGTTGVYQKLNDKTHSNSSEIHQGSASAQTQSNNATASVTQVTAGGSTASYVGQDDGNGTNGVGKGNTASVAQHSTGGTDSSKITQSGSQLYANVAQGQGVLGLTVSNASSYISQLGTGSSASVTQTSAGAQSTITQDGTGNAYNGKPAGGTYNVSVSQSPSSDTSGVNQTSNNNGTVSVQQDGLADTNKSGVI